MIKLDLAIVEERHQNSRTWDPVLQAADVFSKSRGRKQVATSLKWSEGKGHMQDHSQCRSSSWTTGAVILKPAICAHYHHHKCYASTVNREHFIAQDVKHSQLGLTEDARKFLQQGQSVEVEYFNSIPAEGRSIKELQVGSSAVNQWQHLHWWNWLYRYTPDYLDMFEANIICRRTPPACSSFDKLSRTASSSLQANASICKIQSQQGDIEEREQDCQHVWGSAECNLDVWEM